MGIIQEEQIEQLVLHQLRLYWTDIDDAVIRDAIPEALVKIEENFRGLPNSRYFDGENVLFQPYFSIHWMIFLYRLSNSIYHRNPGKTPKEADQVYYLNKIMHATDWFYQVELPIHFLCEHPLGTVLGKAEYGDHLFVYQGTTVGGNRKEGKLYYPSLGNNVILYANSTVLGDTSVGNNVVISSGTYLINEKIPDNCIVFGKSPDIVVKRKSESAIKQMTSHIWNWS